MQSSKSIQSYFTRVSQIKEQLEDIGDNVKAQVEMKTLNGLPRSWESFIQGICAKKQLITFKILWQECTREESLLITREENMGENDDQSLTVITRRNHNKREDHHHRRQRRPRRDLSSVRCYTCDEKGLLQRLSQKQRVLQQGVQQEKTSCSHR